MTTTDRYGSLAEQPEESYMLQESDGLIRENSAPPVSRVSMQTEKHDDISTKSSSSSASSEYEMSIHELLYSSSSYYAIAKPVTLTMVVAALTVCYVNNDATRAAGQAAMAGAYQVWEVDSASTGNALAMSLANALVMVSVLCLMTFLVVLLYRQKCMICLIGYMMVCSATLLGILGSNLLLTAFSIYESTPDKISFLVFMLNFSMVGVVAVFWGRGIPKIVTQAYLIVTSVILAWHLSYFDDWTTWTLLFMLALYDLCAVLTPCGPLKALVNLMSETDAPEMPGLLFEADLPKEARHPRMAVPNRNSSTNEGCKPTNADTPIGRTDSHQQNLTIPLAIAKVYQLSVISISPESAKVMQPERYSNSTISASSLLAQDSLTTFKLPEDPTIDQLRASVVVRLPKNGGRIEQVYRHGKTMYLEKDRHGSPKRILWVDRNGKVFAEIKSDDDECPERNSIRLGLGDFIFYSVLVAKAAQYSSATFAACMLVILAGLGGTLVLLSVYGHALPALPISIFLGVIFYLTTRIFVEPWIEAIVLRPYYV